MGLDFRPGVCKDGVVRSKHCFGLGWLLLVKSKKMVGHVNYQVAPGAAIRSEIHQVSHMPMCRYI